MRRIPAYRIGLAAALAIAGCGAASGADIHAEPRVNLYRLSHDGTKTIVLRDHRRGRHFDVIDAQTGFARGLVSHKFARIAWGEDDDTAYATDREGKVFRLSFVPGEAAIAAIALTGPGAIPAGEAPRIVRFPTPAARFLYARSSKGLRPLYRCALGPASDDEAIPARCEVAAGDGRGVMRWLMTPAGRIVARDKVVSSGEHEFQTLDAPGDWKKLFRYLHYYTALTPIGPVQADNRVWALSNRGRDTVALVRLEIGTGAETVFFRHDRYDIARAQIHFDASGTATPLLAAWNPGYQAIKHFDARLEAAYAALRGEIGEPSRIDLASMDRAGKYAVVAARNPEVHRRWYLLDLDGAAPRELSASDLASYSRPAAASRPVSFPASDGLTLHGYLTLPARSAPPMVLMLHGGPWSRYFWPAPALVRFLGAKGYAVLRLNYRGSTGYGRKFLDAGKGALFARLQQDVLDAARWAVDNGHAARGRIALYGGSFGGFLSLVMLTRHPGAFRAGIAVNGIADATAFWKRDWRRPHARAVWGAFFDSPDLPEAALSEISPVNNLRRFAAPVLLIAGSEDRRVPASHAYDLFVLLEAAGKPVTLVEYRGTGHNIGSLLPDSREHVVESIGEFLDAHLPAGGR